METMYFANCDKNKYRGVDRKTQAEAQKDADTFNKDRKDDFKAIVSNHSK